MTNKLLLATNNWDKIREYKSLLSNRSYELVTLAEVGITNKVEETGESLEENARLKATAMAAESNLVALADDSGLEVAALGGKPGVISARYAGEDASDEERISFLLSQLKDVPWEKRSARFRCVIAVATPAGKIKFSSGECNGVIAFEPRGKEGFGYDPIFYLPELKETMAELPFEVKNRVSHRGQAVRKAYPIIDQLLEVTT
jgi:XTP/dITP diphosphohydrolase